MSYDSGILRDRVWQLDAAHRGPPSVRRLDPLASDITHFIRTLSRVTPVDRTRFGTLPVISPRDADEIVADCGLLGRVQSERADLVIGPIDRDNQYWVSVERMPHQAPRERHLDVSHFNGLPGARARGCDNKAVRARALHVDRLSGLVRNVVVVPSGVGDRRSLPEPWIVRRVGLGTDESRASEVVDRRTGKRLTLDRGPAHVVGLSVVGRRLVWGERTAHSSHILQRTVAASRA